MVCRGDDLKDKKVVCVKRGCVIGSVSDIEINSDTGAIVSVIIYGRSRFMGLFGRENDIVIPWSEISVIGSETILVTTDM